MISPAIYYLLLANYCQSEIDTLSDVARHVKDNYVIEAEASRTSKQLEYLTKTAKISSSCRPKDEFAKFLTDTLRDVSEDGHFYFEVTAEKNNDWLNTWRATGKDLGQGIERVEILHPNIGYIKISSFFELEPALPFYNAAFTLVSDTDALILDLRFNKGGSPETAWPLQWTFVSKDEDLAMFIESRHEEPIKREAPMVLWPRYSSEKPLVILINSASFSAPEAVAYSLQSIKRATIVGERSGGGAHMLDAGVALKSGFTIYTPSSRPISSITNSNWEGVGVLPDIEIESSKALEAAITFLQGLIKNVNKSE